MGLGADFINTPAIVARSLCMNLAYRTLLLILSVSLLTQKQPHSHSHSFTSFLRSFAQLKFTKKSRNCWWEAGNKKRIIPKFCC